MADNNLNNEPTQRNILSSITALFGALNGALIPRRSDGIAEDAAADLGSSTKAWAGAYVNRLFVGGEEVNIAALAGASPAYVFTESTAAFDWPSSRHTKCLAFLYSGGGGAGSTRANGQNGGATTLTLGATTYSSGQGRRGFNGSIRPPGGATNVTLPLFINWFGVEFQSQGNGGVPSNTPDVLQPNSFGMGFPGAQAQRSFLIDGLSQDSTFNIQIGAGGAGGSPGAPSAGGDGGDGFAILFALE